LSKISTLIKA